MTATAKLHYSSMLEVAELLRTRQISSVELTRAMLARIEKLNPSLGAYYTVFGEGAMSAAAQADAEISAGAWRGILHGVPIAFKDMYELGPTTAGSRLLARNVATGEAALVRNARNAGAVILGKLATHEFALAAASLSEHFPPARNPWDPERTPGGSSTGAGTAVAAGLAFGAFGTDTGGSVRLPAAFSGVVGYKPTYGLLSVDGVIPLAPTLDHAGLLARDVLDAAALCAGVQRRPPETGFDGEIRGLRIVVPRDFFEGCDPEVRRLADAVFEQLARAGASVEEVELGVSVLQVMAVGYVITLAEAASYHLPALRGARDGYGHEFGLVLRAGLLLPAHSYVDALQAKSRIAARVDELLERHDVLAMPTVGATADPIPPGPRPLGRRISETPAPQYTWLANLHGGPAVSVPCGLTMARLPAGLQLMGRRGDDATVLRAARVCEVVRDWRGAHPPLWP